LLAGLVSIQSFILGVISTPPDTAELESPRNTGSGQRVPRPAQGIPGEPSNLLRTDVWVLRGVTGPGSAGLCPSSPVTRRGMQLNLFLQPRLKQSHLVVPARR